MVRKRADCEVCFTEIILKNKNIYHSCQLCEAVIHRQCANENHLIGNKSLYYCSSHRHYAPKATSSRNNPSKCFTCNQRLNKNYEHYECNDCTELFHKNCIPEHLRENKRNGKWICPPCHAKPNRNHSNENDDRERELNQEEINRIEDLIRERLESLHFERSSNLNNPFHTSHNPNLSSIFNARRNEVRNFNRETHPQSTRNHSQENDRIPENSTNRNRDRNNQQRGYLDSRASLNTLEQIIDDSIRRLTREDLSADFRTIASIQLHESQKKTYKYLPIVVDSGYSWKLFYRAFNDTKSLYGPIENIKRLQEAIKCEEIKRMGGNNLFNVETYERTLEEIDKRIGDPKRILLKEKRSLTAYKQLNDNESDKIIRFIEQVKQYSDLVDKLGAHSNKYDEDLIAHLSRVLPNKLKTAWTDKYIEIEDNHGDVQIKDLARFLDLKIKRYERSQMFDMLDPFNPKNSNIVKPVVEKNKSNKSDSIQRTFAHRESEIDSDISKEKSKNITLSSYEKKKSSPNYCFYHEKEGHSSLICYILRRKTGKEVVDIAKSRNVCTICGSTAHTICPKKDQLSCIIPNCNMKHESIFCPKRKTITQDNNNVNQNRNKNNVGRVNNNPIDSTSVNHNRQNETVAQEIPTNSNVQETNIQVNRINALGSGKEGCWTIREIEVTHQKVMNQKEVPLITSCTLLSVVVVELGNAELKGAFLLDTGSTTSMIDEVWANRLKLQGPTKPIRLTWSDNQERYDGSSRIVRTKVKGIHKDSKSYNIHFHTIRNLNLPDQSFDASYMQNKYPHLKNLELCSYNKVIGIIGNDQSWFLKQLSWIEGENNNNKLKPIAILTPLGYCVIGSASPLPLLYDNYVMITKEVISENNNNSSLISIEEEAKLLEMQDELMGFEYKLPKENDRKIADEEAAIKILDEHVKKIPGENRYEVPLTWKEEVDSLPTNESLKIAIKRTRMTAKQAVKLGVFDEIKSQIENLISKKYARELTLDEVTSHPNNTFYLPIFVTKQKGKRVRLVWDAAAKVQGKSLNDFLLAGPNLYTDLLNLLFQMREGKFVVKADVTEMFHQIKVIEKDRSALRFVFVDRPDGKLKFYEMSVLIFGAACSPTISQYIKNKVADEKLETHPEAAIAIKKNTYVDDLVVSFNNFENGQKMIYDARKILKEGGFDLVKLKSNHDHILDLIKNEEKIEDNPKLFSNEKMEKILGYNLNFEKDTISLADITHKISPDILNGKNIPTKRDVIKFMMTLFDPLGLFTYYTSKIKLIYHWLCKDKLDWDDKMPNKYLQFWKKCLNWLKDIQNIEIPRSLSKHINDSCEFELIICGDAGKEILCCVAYVKIYNDKNEMIDYAMIGSKSYIVPLNQNRSIPELELDIAVKCTEFEKKLKKCHKIKFRKTTFVTDSACVYHWIQNGASKATIYVKRRLNLIRKSSFKHQWNWINTDLQPADYGTKFDSIPKLKNYEDNKFYKPDLLSLREDDWPKIPSIDESMNIVLHTSENNAKNDKSEEIIQFERFSNLDRIIRVGQCVLSFQLKTKRKKLKRELELCHNPELKQAKITELQRIQNDLADKDFKRRQIELALIRNAQKQVFSEEIETISQNKSLPLKHKLYKFNPFLDDDQTLRIRTRLSLENSNFHEDKVNPIILPANHKITELEVMYFHETNFHVHYNTVVANIKQRFFIANIKWKVKQIVRKLCFKCKRWNAKPDEPLMGNLPSFRLATFQAAFTYVIVDVCGPYKVRVNRTTAKRWLMVFSCLTSRAIHIEIIFRMDSQSCLMALGNLINLRGSPKEIVSDRGTNFIGANNILLTMHDEWNKKLWDDGKILEPIKWNFNPAKASSMSGSVERMIAMIKNVLKKMNDSLDQRMIIPDDEVFRSMICEIIGMLNNRPLIMNPLDGEDGNCYLTPNHFIMLRSNFQSAPKNVDFNSCTLKKWTEIKEYINYLWNHFQKFYLTEIQYRQKWHKLTDPLKIGELVLISDPSINNVWRLGKIIKINTGSCQQVRKVTVRLGKRKKNIITSRDKKSLEKYYFNDDYMDVERPCTQVARLSLQVDD